MKTLTRALAVISALVVAACAESSGPAQPSGGPLSVTLAPSVLACYPSPTAPCSVSVEAVVTNASGLSVSYAWSGCGSGTARNTTCTVERPGQLTVTVDVTDNRGQTARATGTLTGTNQPPAFWVAPTHISVYPSGNFIFIGVVRDPDEGALWGGQYCVSASAAGACDAASLVCPFEGPELSVRRSAASGICEVTVKMKDSWQQVGTSLLTFDVNNPVGTVITRR